MYADNPLAAFGVAIIIVMAFGLFKYEPGPKYPAKYYRVYYNYCTYNVIPVHAYKWIDDGQKYEITYTNGKTETFFTPKLGTGGGEVEFLPFPTNKDCTNIPWAITGYH